MNEQINSNSEEIQIKPIIEGLWRKRKFIFKWVGIGIFVGLVVAFSIPKEYRAGARLAPEFSSQSSSKLSSMSGIASMMGLSMGGMNSGGDAISALLYPDVVNSVPFITDLFSVEVTTVDGELTTTLYDYIKDDQKSAWWSHIIRAPFKVLGWVIGLFLPEKEMVDGLNIEALSLEQTEIFKALRERIAASVDTKTFVISVSVKMQDPKIAADIANIVVDNLQAYIMDYRTQKVKKDLEYSQLVFDEAQVKYYDAQQKYATFEDENKNITSSRYRTELERLENEMLLNFNIYSTLAQSLEQSKLKVQEQTLVYAVIEPVTRPTDDSEPNKPLILIAFTFLAGLASCAYVVFKDKLIELGDF